MKKRIFSLLSTLFIVLIFSSCDLLEERAEVPGNSPPGPSVDPMEAMPYYSVR